MYAVRVSKNFKKGARDVELCKANRLYHWLPLTTCCYPETEKKPTITTIAERNFNNDNDTK